MNKISFILSFISGFVDTAGFIALFGLFTAHITGNLVLAATVLFDNPTLENLPGKLLVLPVFILSVMCTGYLIKYKKLTASQMVLAEAVFIACFAVVGSYELHNRVAPTNSSITIAASFAVIGMAIQTTYMRKLLDSYVPNTVMTENLIQFSIDLFDGIDYYLFRKRNPNPHEINRIDKSLKKVGTVLSGFISGCILGTFLVKSIGLICCLLPSVLLLWVHVQMRKDKLTYI